MTMKEINFDMDGTIANFYGQPDWLKDLERLSTAPYKNAQPLVNMSVLARQLHRLQKLGYRVNVISWLSKSGTAEYNKAVTAVKLVWLKKHLPSVKWDKISIVAYGTPKSTCGSGILFDDEERNRTEWKGIAYNESHIIETLKGLR